MHNVVPGATGHLGSVHLFSSHLIVLQESDNFIRTDYSICFLLQARIHLIIRSLCHERIADLAMAVFAFAG